MKKELFLLALLVVATAQAQNKKAAAPTPVQLVTASGQVVGRVAPSGNTATIDVLVDTGNGPVAFTVNPNLVWAPASNVFFATSDCSGPGYIALDQFSPTKIAGSAQKLNGWTGFVATGPAQPVAYQSFFNGPCNAGAGTQSAAPTTTIALPGPPLYLQ